MNTQGVPLWQKNFQLFSKSYPIIQLTGNIEDLVPYKTTLGTRFTYVDINEWLWNFFSSQPNSVTVFYSSITGFDNSFSPEQLNEFYSLSGRGQCDDFSSAVQKIHTAFRESRDKKVNIIFDQSIRWITAGPVIQPNDQRAFTELKALVSAESNNRLVFLNEKGSDLPSFLLATQSYAKSIVISKPDLIQRSNYIEFLFNDRNFTNSQIQSIAQRADGLTLREVKTALSAVDYSACTPGDLVNQIGLFQFGFNEDPWQQIDTDKIVAAEDTLSQYVFGQDEAIHHASEIIRYASSGFANVMQDDGRTAPKGVMFFCGLSGTGKTELAKAIARLVFGSADSMIRFDMGEYNQPHSAERLTGSPPGYIGHDAGGQLTEAIKARPFSLLLFDEIEKADPTVMNKFLSILEDGRLTDGKGETVSFENTIIVFTSNLGAADAAKETNPELIRQIIGDSVKSYCAEKPPYGIGKPEVYSRLAGNIVVFNPLDEESMQRIFDNYYNQVIKRVTGQLNISVVCDNGFVDKLRQLTNAARDKGDFPGGRGMKKAMDKYFLVPLSSFSQVNKIKSGDIVILNDIEEVNGRIVLNGQIERGANNSQVAKTPPVAKPSSPTAGETRPVIKGFKVKKTQ